MKGWTSVRKSLPQRGDKVQILFIEYDDNNHAFLCRTEGRYLGEDICFASKQGIIKASYWKPLARKN